MNTGIFGEGFPYSNFHDLNMDWIIKIAKDFLDQYTHIQEVIAQGLVDIGDKTEEGLNSLDQKTTDSLTALNTEAERLTALLDQWYNTHSNDIATQLANSLASLASTLASAIETFDTHADEKAGRAIASIPDDYTAFFRQYMNSGVIQGYHHEYEFSSSYTTDIYITAGIEYLFNCTTNKNSLACFVEGYDSDHVDLFNGITIHKFLNSGYLRIYTTSSTTISIDVYNTGLLSNTEIPKLLTNNEVSGIQIHSSLVFDGVPFGRRTISNMDQLTIFNYSNRWVSSSFTYATDVIKIRNEKGLLLYNNLHLSNLSSVSSENDQNIAYLFDRGGNYLRTITINQLASRNTTFLDDEYYAILLEFRHSDGYKQMQWMVSNLKVGWINSQYNEGLFGVNTTIQSLGSGTNKTNIYLEADTDYIFDGDVPQGGFNLFIQGDTDHAKFITYGKQRVKLNFPTSGLLNIWSGRAWTTTFNIYRKTAYELPVQVFHVGTNGDWQSFTEMLKALKNNDNEKIVYVESGTYDIFTEMGGAEFIQTITDPANTNWRDVCNVVPKNTTIIGMGKVLLNWTPDAQYIGSSAMAFLFSPLNLCENCKIVNIEAHCKNGRYAIHCEQSNTRDFDGQTIELENVIAIYEDGSTYGDSNALGVGYNKKTKINIKNSVFKSHNDNPVAFHDNATQSYITNDKSTITMENCVFIGATNSGKVAFTSGASNGLIDEVLFANCYIGGDLVIRAYEADTSQTQKITLLGCNNVQVEYNNNVINRMTPTQYNN